MQCDSKPEDTQDGVIRSMKGDIMCDYKSGKAYVCVNASLCDLLNVNSARVSELLDIWQRLSI
jgi:hypothetical protein